MKDDGGERVIRVLEASDRNQDLEITEVRKNEKKLGVEIGFREAKLELQKRIKSE